MSCVIDIQNLLDLFEEHVPDRESNRLVAKLCRDETSWNKADDIFTKIRDKNLKAIKEGKKLEEIQYCFEEVCAQTLFNITRPSIPFDPDSPYWVIKNALKLVQHLDLPVERISEVVT